MISENLLYYPYINIPKKDWTICALLYYNNIGSIIPREYLYNQKDNLEPEMKELIDHKLVTLIEPYNISGLNINQSITQPLLYILKEFPSFQLEQKRENFRLNKFNRIHPQKFDHEIFMRLEELQLAKEHNNHFLVESDSASLLMTFLAHVISEKLNRQAVTDKITRGFNNISSDYHMTRRLKIIKSLIPFPKEINLNKLISFKEQYKPLLRHFKREIDMIVMDDSIIEGMDLWNERINRLSDYRKEILVRMKESKFEKIISGTMYFFKTFEFRTKEKEANFYALINRNIR